MFLDRPAQSVGGENREESTNDCDGDIKVITVSATRDAKWGTRDSEIDGEERGDGSSESSETEESDESCADGSNSSEGTDSESSFEDEDTADNSGPRLE